LIAVNSGLARSHQRPGADLAPRAGTLSLAGALAVFGIAGEAAAFEVVSVQAEREGPAYRLRIEARFAASPERVLAVLTDYDHVHELHQRITESRSLGQVGPDTEEVYTRFEGCVLFYCQILHRVEHIRIEGGTLFARDVPGRGSFREGSTTWRLAAEDEGARLQYEAHFVPAFKVAPLIGPGLLVGTVERMTLETMAEVDLRALQSDD
jgi:hypothetical protein